MRVEGHKLIFVNNKSEFKIVARPHPQLKEVWLSADEAEAIAHDLLRAVEECRLLNNTHGI
jgi:hypothetical protein